MPRYNFDARRLVQQNSRFYIYFDSLKFDSNHVINDYLIVKPKTCNDNQIAGVCILPYIEEYFCLMKSWRHQFNSEVWQAPAGFIEPNESPIQCAKRELLEETGLVCSISDIIPLGIYIPDAGLIEGKIALYLALRCFRANSHPQDEIGTGPLYFLSRSSLIALLQSASNISGSTSLAAFRALQFLNIL
jgi:8-oxo-dGTP pyrophosphatase MutT (NUDIX family)